MGQLEATNLLKADHVLLKQALEELTATEEGDRARRKELVELLRTKLQMHMALEEEIFYPAFKAAARTDHERSMYYEALEEHHFALAVLRDLQEVDPGSPAFSGKAKVLRELVQHHVKEEEKELFPLARKLLSKEHRRALGEQMAVRTQEFRAAG